MNEIKYIVVNEHTLGYHLGHGMYGVLHASVLKGAGFEMYPGPKSLSIDLFDSVRPKSLSIDVFDSVRPATAQDFLDFRVKQPPDFQPA